MLPIHHIQRAIHAFFTEVNEQALQLLMRHPEHQAEAQRIVRKSNAFLRQYIGVLKGNTWTGKNAEHQLRELCGQAEHSSMELMERVQAVTKQAEAATNDRP